MGRRWLESTPCIALLAGSGGFAVCLVIAWFVALPQPQFHDEFSYLLAGDTFAHGRLTNPPPRLPEFFDTFQVLQRPTYASKYPPLQGVFLALGQTLAGLPIAGVWLSAALACAAAAWALAQRMPRRWALLGALLLATHPLILNWSWSFWGGNAALIGGCLVFGAVLCKTPRTLHGALFAVGSLLLLNSRPFEGGVLVVALAALRWFYPRRGLRTRSTLAALVVVLPGLIWTGYYNWRITGSAWEFPYALYERQYAANPPLLFLPPPIKRKAYSSAALADYYQSWEWSNYDAQRSVKGFCIGAGSKLRTMLLEGARSPMLLVPLCVALRRSRRSRRVQAVLVAAGAVIFAELFGVYLFSHYLGPIVIIFAALVTAGIRRLRRAPFGRTWMAVIVLGHLASSGWCIASMARMHGHQWNDQRAEIIENLRSLGGRHLVFVRTAPGYYAHNEWVYNGAELAAEPVVWAHDLGAVRDAELVNEFPGRSLWLLRLDNEQAELTPLNQAR